MDSTKHNDESHQLKDDDRNTPWYRSSWYRAHRLNLPISMFLDRDLDVTDVLFHSLDDNDLVGWKSLEEVPANEDDLEYSQWEQELLNRDCANGEMIRQSLEKSEDWCAKCDQHRCSGINCCTTATSEQLEDLLARLGMGEDVLVPVLTYSRAEISELLQYSADMSHSMVSCEEDDNVNYVKGFPCLNRRCNVGGERDQLTDCDTCSSDSLYSYSDSQASYSCTDCDDSWVYLSRAG